MRVHPGHDEQLLLAGLHREQAAGREGLAKQEGDAHERVPVAPGQPPHPTDQGN